MTPTGRAFAETGVSFSAIGKLTGFNHTTLLRLRDRDADAKPYRGSKRKTDTQGSTKTARLLRTINLLRRMRNPQCPWLYPSDLNWDLADSLVDDVRCVMDGKNAEKIAKALRSSTPSKAFEDEACDITGDFNGDKVFMQRFFAVVSDWRTEAGRSFAL